MISGAANTLVNLPVTIILVIIGLFIFFVASIGWFYRDPDRHPPKRKNVIVSPADGRVSRIQRYSKGAVPSTTKDGKRIAFEEIEKTGLTETDYWLLAVIMSPLDVHVNRVPVSGQVAFLHRTPGELVRMRRPLFEYTNERITTVLENETMKLGVIQIAAPIASSIKTFISVGEMVEIGQKQGAILLGSQVDLIIPARRKIRLCTSLGSKLKAGETIVAEIVKDDESQTEKTEAVEGYLDVQSRGLPRLLQLFYLANLWIASSSLRLLTGIGRTTRKDQAE